MASILMIEDDLALSRLYRLALEHEEFIVETASDGQLGLNAAFENHPDLILLDIMMPKMNGLEVMNKLRADEWGKTVPIIILSNYDTNDDILDTIVKNMPTYYLIKANIEPEGIILKIKELLKEKENSKNE